MSTSDDFGDGSGFSSDDPDDLLPSSDGGVDVRECVRACAVTVSVSPVVWHSDARVCALWRGVVWLGEVPCFGGLCAALWHGVCSALRVLRVQYVPCAARWVCSRCAGLHSAVLRAPPLCTTQAPAQGFMPWCHAELPLAVAVLRAWLPFLRLH